MSPVSLVVAKVPEKDLYCLVRTDLISKHNSEHPTSAYKLVSRPINIPTELQEYIETGIEMSKEDLTTQLKKYDDTLKKVSGSLENLYTYIAQI